MNQVVVDGTLPLTWPQFDCLAKMAVSAGDIITFPSAPYTARVEYADVTSTVGVFNSSQVEYSKGARYNYNDAFCALQQIPPFVDSIKALASKFSTADFLSFSGTGRVITIKPNTNYLSNGKFILTDSIINFDAQGDCNANFYIIVNGNTFLTNVQINLLNNANPQRINWISYSFLLQDTPNLYGIFVTTIGPNDITMTTTRTMTLKGRLFTTGDTTFIGNCIINATPISSTCVCYAEGSLLLTNQGYKPIESLTLRDELMATGRIIDNEFTDMYPTHKIYRPIQWIGHFSSSVPPICIKRNALGKNQPFQDLYVSPNHTLMVQDEMVHAKQIVNGSTIFQDKTKNTVEYYHVELPEHSVVVANGVLSESYLDLHNRNAFNQYKKTNKKQIKK